MKEKDIQNIFKVKNQVFGFFELKIVKGISLPFSSVAEHQTDALMQAEETGIYHKIQDSPVSWGMQSKARFTKPKPFDCFYLQASAYVVPVWYIPRKRKTAYYIRIKDFMRMKLEADRKSFTEEMAKEYAEQIVVF